MGPCHGKPRSRAHVTGREAHQRLSAASNPPRRPHQPRVAGNIDGKDLRPREFSAGTAGSVRDSDAPLEGPRCELSVRAADDAFEIVLFL
jgi:hypothetical protein